MQDPPTPKLVRIGELSRRTGETLATLRAWESRYGLFRPARSPGGYRLYSEVDERRARAMREEIDAGLSPAQAAPVALESGLVAASTTTAGSRTEGMKSQLASAFEQFDGEAAHAALDELFAALSTDTALEAVILPVLCDLGARWDAGEDVVAQEHFASTLLRGRILGFSRDWDLGFGPRAIVACPPEELHDLGTICFSLALSARGWRVTYLGGNTPVSAMRAAADRLEPRVVVVSATTPDIVNRCASELLELGVRHPVALAGPGSDQRTATRIGASLLDSSDVVQAARFVARELAPAAITS